MADKVKIYEKGLEESPKGCILFGNLVMLLWFALGAIACWYFHPVAAWVYLAFAIIMVYIVLRKLVCTNCYYYDKWCGLGWGKLSALMFKKGKLLSEYLPPLLKKERRATHPRPPTPKTQAQASTI